MEREREKERAGGEPQILSYAYRSPHKHVYTNTLTFDIYLSPIQQLLDDSSGI